jgi:hypothetical protein
VAAVKTETDRLVSNLIPTDITGDYNLLTVLGMTDMDIAGGLTTKLSQQHGAGSWVALDLLTTALTESYAATGAAPTLAQILCMIFALLSDTGISGATLSAKKFDGTTPAMTYTLNDATTPTSKTRAS